MFTGAIYRFDESGMNLTIRDQPIFEDESQAKQAMDEMANTLRMVRAAHWPDAWRFGNCH